MESPQVILVIFRKGLPVSSHKLIAPLVTPKIFNSVGAIYPSVKRRTRVVRKMRVDSMNIKKEWIGHLPQAREELSVNILKCRRRSVPLAGVNFRDFVKRSG